MQAQRIEKREFGFALTLPTSWEERPVNLKNSPWEAARFVEPDDRRHDVTVFRQPLPITFTTSGQVAEAAQDSLEAEGREDFQLTDGIDIAGRTGTLLKSVTRDAGRVRAVSLYFLVATMRTSA